MTSRPQWIGWEGPAATCPRRSGILAGIFRRNRSAGGIPAPARHVGEMKKSIVHAVWIFLLAGMAPSAFALEAKPICVTSAEANLRVGPGKNHRISWEVKRYMPLVSVSRQDEWVKVRDVDGDMHWIFAKLVSGKVRCVTVKNTRARIRSKPTTKSKTWRTVEKYTSFKLLGVTKEWVKVEFLIKRKRRMRKRIGWIFRKLVWPS